MIQIVALSSRRKYVLSGESWTSTETQNDIEINAMQAIRKRANAASDHSIAKQRQALFAAGYKRIRQAINDQYYIEAICILESWMADRLESHLSFVLHEPHAFYTLDRLVRQYERHNVDSTLKTIVQNEVSVWKQQRNFIAHELMKIEEGTHISWTDRMGLSAKPAQEGLILLRKIDRLVTALQRKQARTKNKAVDTVMGGQ